MFIHAQSEGPDVSEISEWLSPPEVLNGQSMPWGAVMIEGNKFLITAGLTGRSPDRNQEYPQMVEDETFESIDQASLEVAPHNVEDQTLLILEKTERTLQEAGTSFENVFFVDYTITERYNWPRALRTMKTWMDENGYEEFFDRPRPNALKIVKGLDHPDMLIEIMMWATVPEAE
jgi:enamine deaminase RidA (YjgF/YER057c/UK114 family)